MSTYDLAVIGGGPGGLATAMYAGLRGISVIAFEAEAFGGQLINLYPGKPVTNFPAQARVLSGDLALRLAEQAAGFGAELREWAPVEYAGLAPGGFLVRVAGEETTAKALVLALGIGRFSPRRLGLAGEERFLGRGLEYRLPPIGQITAEHAVVVGGGDTAFDIALSLRQVAHVTLVHRRDAFSAFAYSQHEAEDAGLEVITGGEVVELRGGEHLEGVVVVLADGRSVELPADLLFVSIGQVPDLRGVEEWGLGLSGMHIEVDSSMQTARLGLHAVGDFASYPGKVRMIATAAAEGSTAAASVERYLLSPN
ncbi:MAG: NAD(P)/FAD-dependent oxidoreductase [Thermoleophilia bacterium]